MPQVRVDIELAQGRSKLPKVGQKVKYRVADKDDEVSEVKHFLQYLGMMTKRSEMKKETSQLESISCI